MAGFDQTRRIAILIEWDEDDSEPRTIFTGSPGEMPVRFRDSETGAEAEWSMAMAVDAGIPSNSDEDYDYDLID